MEEASRRAAERKERSARREQEKRSDRREQEKRNPASLAAHGTGWVRGEEQEQLDVPCEEQKQLDGHYAARVRDEDQAQLDVNSRSPRRAEGGSQEAAGLSGERGERQEEDG